MEPLLGYFFEGGRLDGVRLGRWLFLLFIYATIAAASLNAFYQKWGLRDDYSNWIERRYTMTAMLDGTAYRPFVYKQLLPIAANFFDRLLPEDLKDRIISGLVHYNGKLKTKLNVDPVSQRAYVIRYHFVYYACFAFLFASLFVMRTMCRDLGFGTLESTLAPPLFVLTLPYFASYGGFYYDFPEVFFLAAAFLLAYRGQWVPLIPLAALAALNKESFLFYGVALFPVLRARLSTQKSVAVIAAMVAVAGAVHLWQRATFAGNPGAPFENWILDSYYYYTNVRNLFLFEVNYGVVTPQAYSLFMFTLIAFLVAGAWRNLPLLVKRHTLLVFAINVPLVIVFCGAGEMRNFSLCYMALMLLMAQNLSNWIASIGAGVGVRSQFAVVQGYGEDAARQRAA